MSSAGDGEKSSPEPMTIGEAGDPKPWPEHVLEQAVFLKNDADASARATVRATTARLAEIRATATAHSLSTLEMVKVYVAEADELAVAKLKEGVLVASANPLVSCSVVVGLGVVGLKGPRRFFFRHLRRLFMNEESLLSSAEAKTKELKDVFANLKHEGKKLEERASMAENDFLSGRTRLRHAGQQIEGVIRSTYRVEKEIRGLKDVVGDLPRKDAALFRSKLILLERLFDVYSHLLLHSIEMEVGGSSTGSVRGSYASQGPVDRSVLVLQANHKSDLFKDFKDVDGVKCVEHGSKLNAWQITDERMLFLLDMAGFDTVTRLGRVQLDHTLLGAMVERLRPETHSFHLRHGEMTCTLRDISMITGLRVDGLPVCESQEYDWSEVCMDLLGQVPDDLGRKGSVTLGWLQAQFQHLPFDADEETVTRHTRAFILFQLGCSILADKSGTMVHLKYLSLLGDLAVASEYSWGSAALAHLYHMLDEASLIPTKHLCGFLTFLQLWCWEHLHIGRPLKRRPLAYPEDDRAPLGARWRRPRTFKGSAKTTTLDFYRNGLDVQEFDQVIWDPYANLQLNQLPPLCTEGSEIWTSRTWLINFGEAVMHCPDRVMRQFGLQQHIPEPMERHVVKSAQGRSDVNWLVENHQFIQHWSHRRDHLQFERPLLGANPEESTRLYMEWYWSITVRWIVQHVLAPNNTLYRPRAGREREMVHGVYEFHEELHQIHQVIKDHKTGSSMVGKLKEKMKAWLMCFGAEEPTLHLSQDRVVEEEDSQSQEDAGGLTQDTENAARGGGRGRGRGRAQARPKRKKRLRGHLG